MALGLLGDKKEDHFENEQNRIGVNLSSMKYFINLYVAK